MDKPHLVLIPSDPALEDILEAYRRISGKEPTEKEVEEVKRILRTKAESSLRPR